jgi:beta-phosphoglucomutase-like phosphatase (HAD superfamily)
VTGLAAALFDMDGLLVDTEPVWTVAEEELAARLGGVFTPELKAAIVGTRLEVAVPTILRWYGAEASTTAVADTSAWLLDRMVALFAEGVTVLPGVPELLDALRAEGVPLALVSSSYRVLVDAVLAQGVGPFDVTVAGDEVRAGKPHPEPYLTAVERLGAGPPRRRRPRPTARRRPRTLPPRRSRRRTGSPRAPRSAPGPRRAAPPR